MTEKTMLQELLKLRQQEREIVFNVAHASIENKNSLEQILEHKRLKILEKKNNLLNIDDNSFSTQSYQLMKEQLSAYIKYINSAEPQYSSRNQGLVFRNYLFSKIIRDLQGIAQADFTGVSLPNLFFSAEREDQIDKEMFNEFLKDELKVLKSLRD